MFTEAAVIASSAGVRILRLIAADASAIENVPEHYSASATAASNALRNGAGAFVAAVAAAAESCSMMLFNGVLILLLIVVGQRHRGSRFVAQ